MVKTVGVGEGRNDDMEMVIRTLEVRLDGWIMVKHDQIFFVPVLKIYILINWAREDF